MNVNETTSLAVLLEQDPSLESALEELHIDISCVGDRNLDELVAARILTVESASMLLSRVREKRERLIVQPASLVALMDRIYKHHHLYVEQQSSFIKAELVKLCSLHGVEHPELYAVHSCFSELSAALAMHMKREELLLFPRIKQLEAGKLNYLEKFGSIESLVVRLHEEHSAEEFVVEQLRKLTSNYSVPEEACGSYGRTYKLLRDFDANLNEHMRLENDILFNEAIYLERKILQKHNKS